MSRRQVSDQQAPAGKLTARMTGLNLSDAKEELSTSAKGDTYPPHRTRPASSASKEYYEMIAKLESSTERQLRYLEKAHRDLDNLENALSRELGEIVGSPRASETTSQNLEYINLIIHSIAQVFHSVNKIRAGLPNLKEALTATKSHAANASSAIKTASAGLESLRRKADALNVKVSQLMDMLVSARDSLLKLTDQEFCCGHAA